MTVEWQVQRSPMHHDYEMGPMSVDLQLGMECHLWIVLECSHRNKRNDV